MALKKGKQAVTLKDVAEAVGYSVNTVSRALREKEDISKETRERIQKIALELGYVNNALASSLRLGYTKTIAVILGDISNPLFAIIMKEVEVHAAGSGYTSFLLNTNEDTETEYKAIQTAINKNVDGIILCPTQKSEDNITFLKNSGIPFVLIGRHFETIPTDYVGSNDELGGYQATKYLIEQGHRNILMLNGPLYISSAAERLTGYCRALKEFGIPIRKELICETSVTSGKNKEFLQKLDNSGVDYSAIFAFSDLLAWEAWAYLTESGKKVPEDCSLIGFDHIHSRLPLPFRLTTIDSQKKQMSVAAVELLLERINSESGIDACHSIIIDTSLALGETVSTPKTK